jgi:drug/metabolite transporter (DMT)-like permease
VRTAALTALAMLAFALNSLLCRAALATFQADAASFTLIRLASGAIALVLIVRVRGASVEPTRGVWSGALALFGYALLFSLAYLRITAGTGALLMFAAVQLTMIGFGLARGEAPRAFEWLGLGVSLAGLVVLTLPGLSRPDPLGAASMVGAGAAWGLYSLRGRGAHDPVAVNAASFVRASLFGLPAAAAFVAVGAARLSPLGSALAIVSGAVTSGLGYAVWYAALRGLAATSAAVVQLSVPPLAAGLGVLLLGERISPRLVLASLLILGGIALAVLGRRR